jgi:hypothetical protein
MKIQLDTENKTIKLESKVKLSKLIETLKKLLPNNEWKSFELETNTVIHNWGSPVVIQRTYPVYPYWQPWYTVTNNFTSKANVDYSVKANSGLTAMATNQNNTLSLKAGVFNVEV